MNSVIESEKIERPRIRFTLVNNVMYGLAGDILISRGKEVLMPPYNGPFPRDWNFPFNNYLIHAPIRSGGIRNREKFFMYPSS